MSNEMIENKVKELVADYTNMESDKIRPEFNLEELGLDSLDRVEIVLELEEEFDIQVDEDEIEKIETVKGIIDYIEKLYNT